LILSGINLEKQDNPEEVLNDIGPSLAGYDGPAVVININLLGYETKEKLQKSSEGFKIRKPLLISIVLLSLAILGDAVSLIIYQGLRDGQVSRKEDLEVRKAELAQKEKELSLKQTELNDLIAQRTLLDWSINKRFKWSILLEELRARVPGNLWIERVEVNESLQLTLSGETFDYKTVAMFAGNLEDSPLFANVALSSTKKNPRVKFSELNEPNTDKKNGEEKKTELDRITSSSTKFSIRCQVVLPSN